MEFFNQLGQGLQTLRNFTTQTVLGADYIDPGSPPRDSRTRKQRLGEARQTSQRRLAKYRVGQTMPPGTEMGSTNSVRNQYSPVAPKPMAPSAGTVNASPIASRINPVPTTPVPPQVKAPDALGPKGGVRGGLLGTAITIGSELVIPHVVREATRGARMLAGDPNYNNPVWMKGVNGTNFDIRTSGGMSAYQKAKAAAESASTPKPTSAASNSVIRMGGQEYNMGDPKQKAAYDTAQKAELDRQRERSPMADIRGGDGLSDAGSRISPAPAPTPSGRDTSAPIDPNGAGGKGTSMSYAGFMQDIGSAKEGRTGLEVRDTLLSENLPGTPGYGASFYLNNGKNQQTFGDSRATSQVVNGVVVPKVTLNAAESDNVSSYFENQRQLTPGAETTGKNSQNFGKNQVDLEVMDTSIPKSENTSEANKLARRAAFLNASDSQRGLRAVEGLQGMMTQGGKNFVRDSSAEGGLKEIGQDEYRARRRGGIIPAAQGKAGARLVQSETAATQAPVETQGAPVKGVNGEISILDNPAAMASVQPQFKNNGKMNKKVFGW